MLPHFPSNNYPQRLAEVQAILDCREVRRAASRIRSLRLAPGASPSATASGGCTYLSGVRAQRAVYPSSKALPPLIPDEVEQPDSHIKAAVEVTHPLEGDEHDLPADVRRAVRAVADHIARKEELGAERRRILKILKRIKEDLRPVNARLQKVAPSHVKNMHLSR